MLSLPLAFILSQDQTLHCINLSLGYSLLLTRLLFFASFSYLFFRIFNISISYTLYATLGLYLFFNDLFFSLSSLLSPLLLLLFPSHSIFLASLLRSLELQNYTLFISYQNIFRLFFIFFLILLLNTLYLRYLYSYYFLFYLYSNSLILLYSTPLFTSPSFLLSLHLLLSLILQY